MYVWDINVPLFIRNWLIMFLSLFTIPIYSVHLLTVRYAHRLFNLLIFRLKNNWVHSILFLSDCFTGISSILLNVPLTNIGKTSECMCCKTRIRQLITASKQMCANNWMLLPMPIFCDTFNSMPDLRLPVHPFTAREW